MLAKKTGLGILVLTTLLACNNNNAQKTAVEKTNTHNTLTAEEKKQGWQLLFDGSSYKGWHKYGGQAVGNAWVINDSSIHLDAGAQRDDWQIATGGDIVTDEAFGDFHLKYDWKVAEGGNSGVIFYIHEDTTQYRWGWQTGPEMQVLDNDRHSDAKIHKHRAGDLYDLIASSPETVKPANQWNHAEIKSEKGKLEFYLNGTKVVSTTMWDDAWKAMIAGSKFKDMPGFGTYREGKISLQDHGDKVWYRNIKIRKL